jgi:alpha-galactosidase
MLSTKQTPPMGWNSWNAFRTKLDERTLVEVADALVDRGLLEAGYDYFVIDDGWQAPGRVSGRLVPDPQRFPSGMEWLGDQIRSRGLKLGLYLVPGRRTCAEIFDGYGDGSGLGSFGHEEQDLAQFLDWGVEFLKYDWCKGNKCGTGLDQVSAFTRMSQLVDRAPGELIYSISEYGASKPWEWAPGIAHMWRTTLDLSPRWWQVLWHARRTQQWADHSRPGAVNDPDMLVAGQGPLIGPAAWSHVAMWAMQAAPLFAGNDPRTMSAETARALCDPILITLDQDPLVSAGRIISRRPGVDVWERRTTSGRARLVVNTLPVARTLSLAEWGSSRNSLHTLEGEGAFSTRVRFPGRGSVLLREASLDQ